MVVGGKIGVRDSRWMSVWSNEVSVVCLKSGDCVGGVGPQAYRR